MNKRAIADVKPRRQRSQYTCMACSLAMSLQANGLSVSEDTVNKVMGASPLQGASWEQAMAAAQYFGMRTTLICPATLRQVKGYTDQGIPVMIAWNPEGRPWGHASVIFDVTENEEGFLTVFVADPNIPDPEETVREVPGQEFYRLWYEKWNEYLVRRPAMVVEREITPEGLQKVAKKKGPQAVTPKKDKDMTVRVDVDAPRNAPAKALAERGSGGSHGNRDYDVAKGKTRKEKHKKDWRDKDATAQPLRTRPDYGSEGTFSSRVQEASYDGNPDQKPIYPHGTDHGYEVPIAGGTDVMQQLQNGLLLEQGHKEMVRKLASRWLRASGYRGTAIL